MSLEPEYTNVRDDPSFKMPNVWAEELSLPDVGPLWKDYPITKGEFLARQSKWDEHGHRKNTAGDARSKEQIMQYEVGGVNHPAWRATGNAKFEGRSSEKIAVSVRAHRWSGRDVIHPKPIVISVTTDTTGAALGITREEAKEFADILNRAAEQAPTIVEKMIEVAAQREALALEEKSVIDALISGG